jgi:tRNA 2-thiouridine synthesizing protein E
MDLSSHLDKDGYLTDHNEWTEQIASQLATLEGIDLSAEHWQVIRLLRNYYERTEIAPAMRPLVKLVKNEFGQEVGSSAFLMRLFGGSPAKLAAKIAGLPRPTNCI